MNASEELEISPFTRTDMIAGEAVSILIYRVNKDGWRLRVTNHRGTAAVWRTHFDTEQDALNAYRWTLDNDGSSFIKKASAMLDVMEGFNPDLLQPRDQRYSDPKRFSLRYTLRVFKTVKKYAGLWPVQDLRGHYVSGYLYTGDAPAWPHPCKGVPGAPANIHVEFTLSPDHIESEVIDHMGLKPVKSNYFTL